MTRFIRRTLAALIAPKPSLDLTGALCLGGALLGTRLYRKHKADARYTRALERRLEKEESRPEMPHNITRTVSFTLPTGELVEREVGLYLPGLVADALTDARERLKATAHDVFKTAVKEAMAEHFEAERKP